MPSAHELLAALRTGAPVPDLPAEAVEAARPLARDVASASPCAVEALPEPLALALLEGAVLAASPALPEALSTSPRKAVAKAARRAAYRLRSRGVAVAAPPRTASSTASAPTASSSAAPLPALLSPPDGLGECIVALALPLQGGGLEVAQVRLSDALGVVELQAGEMSRASYRQGRRELLGQRQSVEVPHVEACALLAQAAGLNLRTHTPLPEGLDRVLRHHGVQPVLEPPPLPPPQPEDERLAVTQGAQLHELPEVLPWLPPPEQTRQLLLSLRELMLSPLALSPAQRQEQVLQATRAQAHAFFSPPVGPRYARRLWLLADFLERTGRPHPAHLARAEARRLFHGAWQPPSRFAEFLFEKVLLLAQDDGRQAPREDSLQQEAAEDSSAALPGERRSPGGLILP